MDDPCVVERRVSLDRGAEVRLDLYLCERLGLFTRSQARQRILEAWVNGAPARLSRKVRDGDLVVVRYSQPAPLDLVPEPIPLRVLFENAEVIVVDKPQGMVVHPGSGNPRGTFLNALLAHCRGLGSSFPKGELRPGIVHRLDKETSGVLLAAKTPDAHAQLAMQFHDRLTRKRYLAITLGIPAPASGRIEDRIARDPRHRTRFARSARGGRPAVTRYQVLRSFPGPVAGQGYALVLLAPRTGRTHQLRVHLKGLGTPILGDAVYGRDDPRFPGATLMLHARSLGIRLPGEVQPRTFVAPVPERFRSLLRQLQSFSPSSGL